MYLYSHNDILCDNMYHHHNLDFTMTSNFFVIWKVVQEIEREDELRDYYDGS